MMNFKRILFTKIFLCVFLFSNAQDETKNIIWYSPSEVEQVNGVLLNFWNLEGPFERKIKGVELNLNPLGLFFPVMLIFGSVDKEVHNSIYVDSLMWENGYYKKINGLQIGLVNMEASKINGLDINLSGSFESKVKGVTISGIMNKQISVEGLTMSTMGNHNIDCKGVQIGLINTCRNLKGFQFGLWNKNQKRKLPFINWCF